MVKCRPIRARAVLIRHAREFFERELFDVLPFASATTRAAEKEDKIPGRRQLDKEELVFDFGPFSLVISSPEVAKPLGKAALFDRRSNTHDEGPIDSTTWSRFGQVVRSHRF